MAQKKSFIEISSQTERTELPKITNGIHTRAELKSSTLEFLLGRE